MTTGRRDDPDVDPRNVAAADKCQPCRSAMCDLYIAGKRNTLPNDARCETHA